MERVLFGSLSEFTYEISPVQRQCTQNMSYKASQMRRYRVARYLVRKCGRIDTVLSNVSSIQRPIYSLSFIMQEEKLVKQRACHVGIRAWFQSVVSVAMKTWKPSEQIEDTFWQVKQAIFTTSCRAVRAYRVTRHQRQRISYAVVFAVGEIAFCNSREMKTRLRLLE